MNSKECLNKILDMLNYEQVDECDKKGLLRTIKQDLEILEILKKNITIEKYYAYEILGINLTSVDEDYKKVKEWLKSE